MKPDTLLPPQNPNIEEEAPPSIDVIGRLEHYFRCSALNGEDALPRWATFSCHED